MVTSIKGIAYKLIKSNKFIIISSVISVMLSVALIISMFMFTNNVEISARENIKNLYGDFDISVSYESGTGKFLDKAAVDKITNSGNITEWSKVIVGQLNLGEKQDVPVYAVGLDNSGISKSRYKYTKDLTGNKAALNQGMASFLGISLGDSILISGESFEVVEIMDDISQSSNIPDFVFIDIDKFKELAKIDGEATYLMLKVIDKDNILRTANEIKAIDNEFRIDMVEEEEFFKKNLSTLKTFMIFLSLLIIIMCSLLIMSNFQTFLYNYRDQFALIRAIGGAKKQAFQLVFIQCTFINIIGIFLAVFVSFFISKHIIDLLSTNLNLEISNVYFNPITAFLIAIASFVVLEIFMLFPASKSSKILPMKIIQENEEKESTSLTGWFIGIIGLILSAVLLIVGIYKAYSSESSMLYGVISSLLMIICTFKLFPYYIKSILTKLLPLLRFFGGNAAFVAVKNLIPQVKKNSIIITSLSAMVVVSILGGSFYNTIFKNNEKYLKQEYAMEIVITDREEMRSRLDASLKEEIDGFEGVKNSAVLSYSSDLYYKSQNGLQYVKYCYANIEPLVEEKILPNITGDIRTNVVITKDFANAHDLKVGDLISVKMVEDGKPISEIDESSGFQQIRIGAIADSFSVRPDANIVFDWSNPGFVNEFTTFYKALITPHNAEQTIEGLKNLKQKYPQIKWSSLTQALDESNQVLHQRWLFFIVMLVIIILSLIVGALNILLSNILSKRKEYAILRTLKFDKKSLIKVILTNVILFCQLGVILGCILGTLAANILTLTESRSFSFVDYKLVFIIMALLFIICTVVFMPVGNYLGNRKISQELNTYK